MKSMTGFGKSSYIDDNYEIQIEIKSVNSKVLDLKIVNYKELSFLENEIKDIISAKIRRGKVDVRITFQDKQIPTIEIDENRIIVYHNMLLKVKEILKIKEPIKLDTIIREPDVIIIKKTDYDNSVFREIIFKCLNEAIDNHQIMANKEGLALYNFFVDSFRTIDNCLKKVMLTIPEHKEKLKENLIQSVKQILSNEYSSEIEKRILVETALYIERCDITEEFVRMESHLKNISVFLEDKSSEIGRSMNFILQEMQREVNTISSKYTTTGTFVEILRMKEEVEKCKEQVQNVE